MLAWLMAAGLWGAEMRLSQRASIEIVIAIEVISWSCKAEPILHTSLVIDSRSPALAEESLATSGLDVIHMARIHEHYTPRIFEHYPSHLYPQWITVHSHRCTP